MRSWCCAALAVMVLAWPVSAQTSEALDLVPDDALGFVMIKNLRELSDRVEALAKKVKVEEHVSLLELIQKDLGIQEGLNDKGSALFIVVKGQKEQPGVEWVSAFPVKDHAKVFRQLGVQQAKDGIHEGEMPPESSLLAAIGGQASGAKKKSPALVAKKGAFVLVTPPANRVALDHILRSDKSIAPALKAARAWLDDQDIAGVCTDRGTRVGLAMALAGFASTTSGQATRMKEAFAEFEKNLDLIGFGARIEKEGHYRLLTRAYVKPDGSYARWLAQAPPLEGKLLARLPDQRYIVAAFARISPQTNFEGLLQSLVAGTSSGESNELTASASRLLRRVSEVGLTFAVPSDPAKASLNDVALLALVDDASPVVEQTVALLKQAQRAAKESNASKETLHVERAQVAGKPSRLITSTEKGSSGTRAEIGKASAADGPVGLLTELDAQTVLACLLPKADAADATVKRFTAGPARSLGGKAALKKTAALLPARPQAAAYVDIGSLAMLGLVTLSSAGGSDVPPLGFALATFPQGIEAQCVIPFETLEAVAQAWKAEKK